MQEEKITRNLEDMMNSAELLSQARFQASLIAKVIQSELYQIAERTEYSIENLIIAARGDSDGVEAFHGKSRASLVVAALACLNGSEFDTIDSIIIVTLKNFNYFSIEPITGQDLLSTRMIEAMHKSELLDDDMYQILNDDSLISSLQIEVGSFVVNKFNPCVPMIATATDRLLQSRKWCNAVLKELPPNISLAEIIRLDQMDGTAKFRDFYNPSNQGWVKISNISLLSTTRKSELVKSRTRSIQHEE
jgi:hypothetical protein